MAMLFIVGAQRSGSTYLYRLLDEHPQISMAHPVRPEPKFFLDDKLVEKGREYYESTYFNDRKPGSVYFGEKSTSYFEHSFARQRLHGFYPEAKILMILRDPVLRAYSNYRFSVDHGIENMSFLEALHAETERGKEPSFSTSVSPFAYRQRGNYIEYIAPYLDQFAATQLRVLIFEEFVGHLDQVQALYRWLDVKDGFVPESLNRVANPATTEKKDESEAFRSLAVGYRESLARLETFLGRKLEVWRKNHREFVGAGE